MGRRGKRPSRFEKWFDPIKQSVSSRWAGFRNVISGKHRRRDHLGAQYADEGDQAADDDLLNSAASKKNGKRKFFKTFRAKINKKIRKVPIVHEVADPQLRPIAGQYQVINVLPAASVYDVDDVIQERPRTPENYYETYGYFEHYTKSRQLVLRAIYKLGDRLILGVLVGDRDQWKQYVVQTQRDVQAWKEKCRQSDRLFKETGKILGVEEARVASLFYNRAKRYIRGRLEPVKERVTNYVQENIEHVQEFRRERKRLAEVRASQPSDYYTPAELVTDIVTPIKRVVTEARENIRLEGNTTTPLRQRLADTLRKRLRKYFGRKNNQAR